MKQNALIDVITAGAVKSLIEYYVSNGRRLQKRNFNLCNRQVRQNPKPWE